MGMDDRLRKLRCPVSLIESGGMNDVNHGQGSIVPGVLPSRQVIVIFYLHLCQVLSNNMEKPVLSSWSGLLRPPPPMPSFF